MVHLYGLAIHIYQDNHFAIVVNKLCQIVKLVILRKL